MCLVLLSLCRYNNQCGSVAGKIFILIAVLNYFLLLVMTWLRPQQVRINLLIIIECGAGLVTSISSFFFFWGGGGYRSVGGGEYESTYLSGSIRP